MIGAYIAWQIDAVARATSTGSFWLAVLGAALRVALLGGVDRALPAAPPVQPRGTLPAAVHLRAGADPRRCRASSSGARSSSRSRARRASPAASSSSACAFRTTTSSSSCSGPLIALGFWLLLNRTEHRPHDPRRGARPRDAGGARRQRRLALHAACSWLARSSRASAARWSRRSSSIVPGMDVEIIVEAFIVVVIGGLGSLWGTLPRRAHLRPGARLRHPGLPALLDLRGVRADGGRADRAAVGPAGEAGER